MTKEDFTNISPILAPPLQKVDRNTPEEVKKRERFAAEKHLRQLRRQQMDDFIKKENSCYERTKLRIRKFFMYILNKE